VFTTQNVLNYISFTLKKERKLITHTPLVGALGSPLVRR